MTISKVPEEAPREREDTDDSERKLLEELRQKIDQAKLALFEKYKEYGAKLEHFKEIRVGDGIVVAYVGDESNHISNGLDLTPMSIAAAHLLDRAARIAIYKRRTWNSIQADAEDPRFKVTVGETEYDTRQGMTLKVQQALVDQGELTVNENGNTITQLWLTGEKEVDSVYAPVTAEVEEGVVCKRSARRDHYSRRFLFCPVIVLVEDSAHQDTEA
jgi:hypothetical protein